MRFEIQVDTSKAEALAAKFPRAAEIATKNFVERVGFTIEAKAKKSAPVITGYLRRSIAFVPSGGRTLANFTGSGRSQVNQTVEVSSNSAVVVAYANYAKYVHGAPFYTHKRSGGRTTPFFTYALFDSQSAIRTYQSAIIKDIAKNIGN